MSLHQNRLHAGATVVPGRRLDVCARLSTSLAGALLLGLGPSAPARAETGISINGTQLPVLRPASPASSFAGGGAGMPGAGGAIDPDPAQAHGTGPGQPPAAAAATPQPPVAAAPPVEPPNGWSDGEIKAAQEQCRRKLAGLDAQYAFIAQVKSGACGTPAPIELSGFGKHLAISPPITVTCDIAATLHGWIKTHVQPLAKRHLGTSIVQINTMSSYACRNRYGARNAPLSQHAFANAIDVRGFVTAKGQLLDVEQHWGPTAKELAAYNASLPAAAVAHAPPASPIITGSVPNSAPLGAASASSRVTGEWATTMAAGPALMPAAVGTAPGMKAHESPPVSVPVSAPVVASAAPSLRQTFPVVSKVAHLSTIGPIKIVSSGQVADLGPPGAQPGQPLDGRANFFRETWGSACGVFMTVLGPEANRAHRNHLHVDLAQRKTGAFCQ